MPPRLPLGPLPSSLERQCYATVQLPRAGFQNVRDCQRSLSTFGYHQAKSLVYSQHGNVADVLDLHTYSIAPPHSSLVTLRTLSAPLNPADINQIQGKYPIHPPFTTALSTRTPSAVPGNEGCFEVVATGSSVKTVAKGDWVIPRATGLGTWRTHLQVDEAAVMPVDRSGLTHAQVATVSVNPVTAWRMLKDFGRLQEGDWFVQNGANSAVGRLAIQLGRMWGFKSIAIIRKRPGPGTEALKKELEGLGATKVVTDDELMQKDFPGLVKEWRNGGRERLGLGLNCVGGRPLTGLAQLLSPGGQVVTYGAMGEGPIRIPAGALIFNDLVYSGFWVSRWSDAHPEEKRRTVEGILALMRAGQLREGPVAEVPWKWETPREELVQAVRGTLEGHRNGKGLFVFEDGDPERLASSSR